MARRRGLAVLTLGVVLSVPGVASGQAWDVPSFLPPEPVGEFGAAFVMPEHANWGLLGYWRQPGAISLGVRAGFTDVDDGTAITLGSEFLGRLITAGPGLPFDLSWTAGVGGTFMDDHTGVRVPVGLTGGFSIPLGPGLSIVPYVHPRIALDWVTGGGESETKTSVSVDAGAGIGLGENLILRAAGSFADTPAWGIGLSWVGGRAVAAR